MEHIKIEQNSNVEVVDSNIIHKLAEEAQDCDASSNMTGNLQTDKAFRCDVSYLTTKFPGLTINVTGDYYKSFVDPAANEFFAKCPAGDGEGILETEFAKLKNTWGYSPAKYRYCNNNDYFGSYMGVDAADVPLSSILRRIEYLPEIADLPIDTSGEKFGGYYVPVFLFMINLKEYRCPKTAKEVTYNLNDASGTFAVETIDMSDADAYTATEISIRMNSAPNLKKIVLPPSVSYFDHGSLIGFGSSEGMNIFAYATDLSTVPSDVSGWALKELPHTATLWVQDSVYNDWLQHKQIVNNNNVIVKKFSEYTGDDLVQKWLEPSND